MPQPASNLSLIVETLSPRAISASVALDHHEVYASLTLRAVRRVTRRALPPANFIERLFNKIKHRRGLATRRDQRADIFPAGGELASIRIRLRFNESRSEPLCLE